MADKETFFKEVQRLSEECVKLIAADETIPRLEALKMATSIGFINGAIEVLVSPEATWSDEGATVVAYPDDLDTTHDWMIEEIRRITIAGATGNYQYQH